MRSFFFTVLLMTVSFLSGAQATDCTKLKNGSFKQGNTTPEEVIIVRKGKIQTEENLATGIKLSMEVTWTGDCTYELKNVKVLKGEAPFPIFEDVTMFNEIIEVNQKNYRVRCWMSNTPDQKMEFTLQIL